MVMASMHATAHPSISSRPAIIDPVKVCYSAVAMLPPSPA